MQDTNLTDQQLFDKKYITGAEIARVLCVSRTAMVNARNRGMLPDHIAVNGSNIFIWEREKVNPHIESWKTELVRRGKLKNG